MHKGSLVFAILTVFALQCRTQVLAPAEVLDPAMRVLQQQHFAELKSAAVEITSHQYPFRFYLSRTLDLTEQQEQQSDQRSIRFSNFQGLTVLQVTGNYFAAYSEDSMDRNQRVKQTYLDVILPILRATVLRISSEPQLNAFAIEVAQHVRKKVLGVTVEHPENLALIVPRATAEKAAKSSDVNEEVTALLESRIFIDGSPVRLWPQQDVTASADSLPPSPVKPAALADVPAAPNRTVPAPPAPVQDVSPDALRERQASYQGVIDRIVHELNADAHFVAYAPPVLIGFREKVYLQLSITTSLAPADWGSQYRVAALSFDRHVSHLIRPLLALMEKDPEFHGIVFSSTARVSSESADSTASQSVEFFLPLAELRRYAQYDLTGQQLINSGLVLINGERVGLELQSAESDLRQVFASP